MDLKETIDRYLDESLEGRRMSMEQATDYRFQLVGDPSLPLINSGFVRFLEATGMASPTLDDLNAVSPADLYQIEIAIEERKGGRP